MRDDEVRVGVIGAGYWGPNLIRNFAELPDVELKAIADVNPDHLARVLRRYPRIEIATTDYRDLFDQDLDAVALCTPPQTHHRIAADCLAAGLHVLVEKPLTTSSDQARDLIALAEEHDRTLMVGHTFEYNSAVAALKKMLTADELGHIHYIDAVRVGLGLFHPTLNVAWDLGPHDISILIHLLGELPESVMARGVCCVQPSVEDVIYLTLGFPNGVLAHLRLSWLDPNKTRRLTIIGNKKMAIYDDVESLEKVRVYDKGVEAIRRTETLSEFFFDYRYGSIVSPYIHFEEPLTIECRHFIDCVRTGRVPRTDGYNGLRVVEVIEAAQRSLKAGGLPIAVEYSERDRHHRPTHGDLIDLRGRSGRVGHNASINGLAEQHLGGSS